MSAYKDELVKAMNMLGERSDTVFLGQSILYPGHIMTSTLAGIPKEKMLEFPVAEELQLSASIGLALEGWLPVSLFPRMDFLMRCMDSLVNHLDKMEAISQAAFKPKVLIRTMIGSIHPLHPGPQHCQDYTVALRLMLTNINVVCLEQAKEIVPAYRRALKGERSTILVEAPPRREGYD